MLLVFVKIDPVGGDGKVAQQFGICMGTPEHVAVVGLFLPDPL